jgi:hypothetical protein
MRIAEYPRLAAAEEKAEQDCGNEQAEDIQRYQDSPGQVGLFHSLLEQPLPAHSDSPLVGERLPVLTHRRDYREFVLSMR